MNTGTHLDFSKCAKFNEKMHVKLQSDVLLKLSTYSHKSSRVNQGDLLTLLLKIFNLWKNENDKAPRTEISPVTTTSRKVSNQ